MIKFLLQEIEKSPNLLFSKKELIAISPSDFADLTEKRIVNYVNPHPSVIERIKFPRCSFGCALSVKEVDGKLEAFCLRHPSEGITSINNDDLCRYTFLVDDFLKQVCVANKLEDKIQRIDKKYFYLGHKFYRNQRINFIFVYNLGDDKLVKLSGLKHLCKEGSLIILTPVSTLSDITLESRLHTEQVIQISLADYLNLQTFELPLKKILGKTITPKKEASKITIKLLEIDGKLRPDISGELHDLVQRLRDSYKLTAIIICAGAYNNETPRSLTHLTNNLIRYGFKKGRNIRGRADSKTRVKNLEREVRILNKHFEDSGLTPPLIKESGILKWSAEIDGFISFEDERGTRLKAESMRNLLSKYRLSSQGKEPVRKPPLKTKTYSLAPDKLDYAANPSRQSIQRQLEGKHIREESGEDD